MRHRVEDLGRLAVMLTTLLDHELFNQDGRLRSRRPKDYDLWWESLNEEQKDEALRSFQYGLDDVGRQLYDMLSVAEGTDLLNSSPPEET